MNEGMSTPFFHCDRHSLANAGISRIDAWKETTPEFREEIRWSQVTT
jgi:hypothetical protein